MMIFPLLAFLLSSLAEGTAAKNVKEDFMKRMESAMQHNKPSLAVLQQRLMAHAVPRKLSDTNTSEFDLSQYALKYIGCQNIKSFSDSLASDTSSKTVLALSKFVMFRFCDSNLCSSYNKYGCSQNFGEYMIDMESYLVTMADYHYSRYQDYCTTCISCMASATLDDTNSTDDYISSQNGTNGTTASETLSTCEYYSACENYKSACSEYGKSNTQYENFFTCTEFKVGNNVAYLGPHCGKNGKTIRIGIFNDADCLEYIGDILDLEQYTGMAFDKNGLAFYDGGDCISCVDKDVYELYPDDDAAGQGVYDLCTVLYDAAGKCNRYLNVADQGATYASYQQEENELKVCNFIDSLVENHYDEYGEIVLGFQFNTSNWNDYREYYKVSRSVAPIQIVGLVASIFLVIFLFFYSLYLHSKIMKLYQLQSAWYEEWHPARNSRTALDAGKISRIQSGIMAGRSTSNFSFPDGTNVAYA